MSRSESHLCTFADLASAYRIYILDDLLAEPQEICYDWYRNVLYVSQRFRQGNIATPIESSQEIAIVDLTIADQTGTINISPWHGPHGLELDEQCAFLYASVDDGGVWVEPESGSVSSFADLSTMTPAESTSDDCIAEVDLRNGRMRQRVNVPQSQTPTDGRYIAFSAPAIRYAARSPSSGLPVLDVANDMIIEIIRSRFSVKTLYVTSRNIILV